MCPEPSILILPITFPLSFKFTVTPLPFNPSAKPSTPALFSIVPLFVNVAVETAETKTVDPLKAFSLSLLLWMYPPELFIIVILSVSSSDLTALLGVFDLLISSA